MDGLLLPTVQSDLVKGEGASEPVKAAVGAPAADAVVLVSDEQEMVHPLKQLTKSKMSAPQGKQGHSVMPVHVV